VQADAVKHRDRVPLIGRDSGTEHGDFHLNPSPCECLREFERILPDAANGIR
jgi:hypothetical protein